MRSTSFFKCLSLALFCMGSMRLLAQVPTTFTERKPVYLEEITRMFESTGNSAELNEVFQTFALKFKEFDAEEEKFIYETSNLMLKKGAKAEPGFHQFLMSVYYFKTDRGAGNYEKWKTIIGNLAKGKSKPAFEKYLEAVYQLLKSQELYSSAAVTWSVSSPEFILVNDSIPAIVFKETTLKGKTKGDFCNIYETSGSYFPTTLSWYGTKGRINWERAGINAAANFVTFGAYDFTLNSTQFGIDTVTLTCEFYKTPMLGSFKEKMLSTTPERVDYPVFNSFNKRVKVEEILPNIDYLGGFALKGSRFAGVGQTGEPSVMVFKTKG
ncbi:MAG: hypothetical protein V4616_07090, partial [Bacteroidota bacterium]